MTPSFSIVIPLYNKENQIKKTLESIFNQTYQNCEIVIIDDGSTDNSIEVIKKNFNDSRVRIISQENSGVSAARNRGIKEANNEYIAFLDADDEWKEDYLSIQVSLIKKYPECSVFATNYEFKDEKGVISSTKINKLPFKGEDGILNNYFEVASCSHPPLWTSAIIARKKVLEDIGGFPEGIKSGEDLLTWARLACNYKIAYSNKSLAQFFSDPSVYNEDQRKRRPEKTDYVGFELNNLLNLHPDIKGFKNYVGLWHKMRCKIFISKFCRKEAIWESCKAIKYNINVKNIIFLGLSLLPFKASNAIINKFS